jgi:hypothetical protein
MIKQQQSSHTPRVVDCFSEVLPRCPQPQWHCSLVYQSGQQEEQRVTILLVMPQHFQQTDK